MNLTLVKKMAYRVGLFEILMKGAIPKTLKFVLITKRKWPMSTIKKKKKASFAINENVQDLISAFYYLRISMTPLPLKKEKI